MPTFSIITATYNRGDIIDRTIDSVISQSFKDFEYIIVDDGSTDATREVVEQYDDDRIQYVKLDNNQGANSARNRGIKKATGKYVSFLDSDDEYLPTRLEFVADEFSNCPEDIGCVFHSYEKIYPNDDMSIVPATENELSLSDFSDGNPVGSFLAATFRQTVFDSIGYLDEKMPACQDIEFYIRVADQYSFRGFNEILGRKRAHSRSISASLDRRITGEQRLIEKHGQIISNKRLEWQHFNRVLLAVEKGKIDRARQELVELIKLNPIHPKYHIYFIMSLFGQRVFAWCVSSVERHLL
jgi:glycosyltransferase involved in cell wall biosynthesis